MDRCELSAAGSLIMHRLEREKSMSSAGLSSFWLGPHPSMPNPRPAICNHHTGLPAALYTEHIGSSVSSLSTSIPGKAASRPFARCWTLIQKALRPMRLVVGVRLGDHGYSKYVRVTPMGSSWVFCLSSLPQDTCSASALICANDVTSQSLDLRRLRSWP